MRAALLFALALLVVAAATTRAQTAWQPQVTLAWVAPPTNVDGSALLTPVTYNVYYASSAAGPFTTRVATGVTGTTTALANQPQAMDCYTVTAVDSSGAESDLGQPPACVNLAPKPPPSKPLPPTGVAVVQVK